MKNEIKKTKAILILEAIAHGINVTAEIFDSLFPSMYESYREMMGRSSYDPRFRSKADWREYKRNLIKAEERQRFYNLLWKLKKQGFIKKSQNGFWHNTDKARSKIKDFLSNAKNSLPAGRYRKEPSAEFKIIVFDIPEREKRKRNWLRAVLNRIGFKMLQRSVWIGKMKLPEEFINDLRILGLLDFVEILAITKTGSLRQLE